MPKIIGNWRKRMACVGGSLGSSKSWPMKTSTAMALAAPKATRHPTSSPTSAPAGTPATVPSETPAKMMDMARDACCGDTRRGPMALPMAQKPPTPTPSMARPSNIHAYDGASATSRFEATSRAVRASSTMRRSRRPEPTVTKMAAKAATMPGVVIISPAWPLLMASSAAMAGSRPTGRNSEVTRAKAPMPTDRTASHGATVVSSPVVLEGVCIEVPEKPGGF
ncbi:hypothetical protein D3C71_336750 [compost metagenome]